MTRLDRFRIAVLAGLLALSSNPAPAQTGITEDQRREYGRQFRMASATELKTLLDAQQERKALSVDEREYKDFLRLSKPFKAIVANQTPELGYLLFWNEVALQMNALDHTNPDPNPNDPPPPYYGEQFGPPRSSRVLAIVHLAMFEAVNAISRAYRGYGDVQGTIFAGLGVPIGQVTPASASKNRAIIEAAYRSLVALYPNKKKFTQIAYDLSVGQFGNPNDPATVQGAKVGALVAQAVLDLRHFDGSELPDLSSDDFNSANPLTWHQDPISKLKPALGGNWPRVKPFLIDSGDAFRDVLPGPPDPGTPAYIDAYKRTRKLGGDPMARADGARAPTPTDRTGSGDPDKPTIPYNEDQTFVGIFWAYDGSAFLCAPPRLYNMIATSVALKERPIANVEDFAAYLAYLNLTMADAGLAAWDAKYFFIYPRPVTLLRLVDADATPDGARNPLWTPLGGQSTNAGIKSDNFTPPFPAYPSGHATFGAALFRAMALFYQSIDPTFPDDGVAFDFISDEYNGQNHGAGDPKPRATVIAHFDSFRQAAKLNADSRIYLGVHWPFDADDGILLGDVVARNTFGKFVRPLPRK